MITAIQLELFSDIHYLNDISAVAPIAGTIDPCIGCELREACDADECGMKLYPIDVPTLRFPNLNEYILFLKQHDWL